jgi:hypothetical protein
VNRLEAGNRLSIKEWVKEAPVNLVYVADTAKMGGGDEEAKTLYSGPTPVSSHRMFYLYCASEGLATVVRASIDKPALSKALNPHLSYDPEKDWFSNGGWGYQSGWERVPDFYLAKDDVPRFPAGVAQPLRDRPEPLELDLQRAHDARPARQVIRGISVSGTPANHARHGGGRAALARAGHAARVAGAGAEDRRDEHAHPLRSRRL